MSFLPVIAVVGGTGHLGKQITGAILNKHTNFSKIIVLSRSENVQPPPGWPSAPNLEMRAYDQSNPAASFNDADVLVNTIGSGHAQHMTKDAFARALPSTKVRLYFPSEFGIDHSLLELNHPEWARKRAHFTLVRQLAPNVQVCCVYAGLFLEDSIGPWFGFYTDKDVYEAVGSADQIISFTSMTDVGNTVAELARRVNEPSRTLKLLKDPPVGLEAVPMEVKLCGDSATMRQIADLMQHFFPKPGPSQETDSTSIRINILEFNKFKEDAVKEEDPAKCLRFLMGDGKINHSVGHANELVNPGETVWKWKKLQGLAKETSGRPHKVAS